MPKNFTGPLDAIVEGDSEELEGGDSEQSYGSLSEVVLDGAEPKKSVKGMKKVKSVKAFLGLTGKSESDSNKTTYYEDGSWQECVLSLSWGHVYEGIK